MSTRSKSNSRRGFASMDPEKRREIAKRGGHASRQSTDKEKKEGERAASVSQRGFAAMDVEKRKEIASKGGSSSRRNRIDWKDQAVIL